MSGGMSADSDYHRYVFFVQWISGLDTSQMVYGHVDGNEIWYIRGEKQTLNAREAGYTDADNEVVIYLDQNDNCERIISREKWESQQITDIAGSLIAWSIGIVSLIVAIRYCENKYCWQFKIFWKWYDRFIRNKDLDIDEFIYMKQNCNVEKVRLYNRWQSWRNFGCEERYNNQ